MSKSRIIVSGWSAIANAPTVSDRDKQRVATIFSEQSWEHVVWIPSWLLEEKDVETVEQSDHLAVGDVEDYSAKAWKMSQPHRDAELGSPEDYLPKSETLVFQRHRGVETIETPQQGLTAFEGGEDG